MGEGGNGKSFFGRVTHVYKSICCVAIKAKDGALSVGDTIRFSKNSTNKENPDSYQLDHRVISMQINRKPVPEVSKGQEFAVKLDISRDALPPNNSRVIVLQD
jgi:hypothetical protein